MDQMGEATWADVAPEDLGRAQAHERWTSGHRVALQLAVLWWYPGCRMLSSLATTKGVLAPWAGKKAGLVGTWRWAIWEFSDQVEFGAKSGAGRGWGVPESNEAFSDLCVGWKAGKAINLSILYRHSIILAPPCSRMSELDQTRRKLPSGLLGLEHCFMLAVVHLRSPFHLCSNPVRWEHT